MGQFFGIEDIYNKNRHRHYIKAYLILIGASKTGM